MQSTPQAAPAVAPPEPIRYRPETSGSAGSIGEVLVMLVVLLGAFVGALLVARKQGWLARWGVVPPQVATPASGLRLEQALRLSPRTVLFRVRSGEQTLLVLESNGAAQIVEERSPAKEQS